MSQAFLSLCGLFPNATTVGVAQAHYQTQIKGGFGAVRELCDLILLAHGKLDNIHGASI